MADYYRTGHDDARRKQFYANGLPCGTLPNSETRATYRAGWIVERASRGIENLPAYFLEAPSGRYYWIVAIDHDKRPIFNVSNGAAPTSCGGYRDLRALMALKGDTFT